uniref:Uncharacterized protein n=1 Tax=Ditylenchus dipsaci TaxID=166011 RepID=A0A915DR02_9BILA
MLTGLTILHFLDAQKYFNAKHKMLIELDLSFKDQVEKLSAKNAHLFSESSPYTSDCSILVGGEKIYVDKKL